MLESGTPDYGLWLLLGIAFYIATIPDYYSGHKELYMLGTALIGALIGIGLRKQNGAAYGLAIGAIVGYFVWFIFTCQFCN